MFQEMELHVLNFHATWTATIHLGRLTWCILCVCVCAQATEWLPMPGIFNMYTDVNLYNCTQRQYECCKSLR